MSMITATTWAPRGYAAPFPTKYVLDEDEFALAKLQLEDAEEDLEQAKEAGKSKKSKDEKSGVFGAAAKINSAEDMDDDLKEYDLDNYDNDEEEDKVATKSNNTLNMFGNVKALAYHESNADDPYITLPDHEDEDEERAELQIMATDNLVVAARVEDEIAHLEIYVYEDEADNLYVHHDIMLPDIPLCVEWLDIPVNKPSVEADSTASFVAVGTMGPDIEIWDLDTVDAMFPNATLGAGADELANGTGKPKKKKKKKSKKPNDDYHVDAILSLAANRKARNLLASSSADTTIKLWDLHTTKCAKSYSYHTDKVSSLAWHWQEATVLLSGSYDRTIVAADMRAPNAKAPRWGTESDVEGVRWDPHNEHRFFATTENGLVHYYDTRNAPSQPSHTKPLWSLQAHDESISSFDVNRIIPGFLVTGSNDKEVKLWNVQESGPSMVVSRDLGVGKVFSTTFAPDQEVGFRLAVAGSKGALQIWDTSTNAAVRRIFADRVAPSTGEVKERLVGLDEPSSESESGEDVDEAEEGAEDGWEDEEDGEDDVMAD